MELTAQQAEEYAEENFPDWVGPMLVKEFRQGFRARLFLIPFVVIHLLAIIVLFVEFVAAENNPGSFADAWIKGIFWMMVSLILVLVLPMRGLASLQEECSDSNAELLLITGLSRWKIVIGKWLVQCSFAGLIFISMLPYLLVRYFLGGVELWQEFMTGVVVFCCSAASCAIVIGASGYPNYIMRLVIAGSSIFMVSLSASGLVGMIASPIWDDGFGMRIFITLFGGFLGIGFMALYCIYGLQLGRAHLKLYLHPLEVPTSRLVVTLIFLSPFMLMFGMMLCYFPAAIVLALLIWWALWIDRRPKPPPVVVAAQAQRDQKRLQIKPEA